MTDCEAELTTRSDRVRAPSETEGKDAVRIHQDREQEEIMTGDEFLRALHVFYESNLIQRVVRETMRDQPGPGDHPTQGRGVENSPPDVVEAIASAPPGPIAPSRRSAKQDPAGTGGAGRRRRPAAKVQPPACGQCKVFVQVVLGNDEPAGCSQVVHLFFECLEAQAYGNRASNARRDEDVPAVLPLEA